MIIAPVLSGVSGSGLWMGPTTVPPCLSLVIALYYTQQRLIVIVIIVCGGCDEYFCTKLTSDEEVGSAYWAGVVMKVTVSSFNCGFAVARTVA